MVQTSTAAAPLDPKLHPLASARASSACRALPGRPRPTSRCASAPARDELSKSIPVSTPMPCSMYTRSSVARFPEAPGAYGQPPSPPIDASKVVMPSSSPTSTFASAVPRVSCMCSASCSGRASREEAPSDVAASGAASRRRSCRRARPGSSRARGAAAAIVAPRRAGRRRPRTGSPTPSRRSRGRAARAPSAAGTSAARSRRAPPRCSC